MLLKYSLVFYFTLCGFILNILGDQEITTSLKCANLFRYYETKYDIPKDLLHAISIKETSKIHSTYKIAMVWPWSVNIKGQSYYFNTKSEAINFVKHKIHKGETCIDIGCLQINLGHHPYAFANLEQAFDPSININYAANFLRSKYDKLQNWDKAIAHYHSATKIYGDKYLDDVKKIATNIKDHKKKLTKFIHNPSNLVRNSKPKSYNLNKKLVQKKSSISNSLKAKNLKSDMMVHIPKKQ